MNGLTGSPQTSGNNWTGVPLGRAYKGFQETHTIPELPQQGSLIAYYEEQMLRSAFEHKASIDEIQKRYVLPADGSVKRFLADHRTVPQLLLEAVPHLQAHFGADIVLALKAPADEFGSRTLYGVVMWPGSVAEARQSLNDFDDDGWIANARHASGFLTFTYELV